MITLIEYIQGLTVNLFVLLGFVALFVLYEQSPNRKQKNVSSWQFGILTGVMALVSMFVPVVAEAGYFDSRSGVIGTGALLRGPVAALVSLPLPLLYRFYMGEPGTIPGLLEIVLPALLGSLCHMWIVKKASTFKISYVIISSLLTGLITTLIVFGVVAVGIPVILELMPGKAHMLIFILYAPVSMALLSSLIVVELRHFHAVEAVEETEKRMLHSQKMAAVGQLSRKLAHNFANALNIILGNAQLAKAQVKNHATVQDLMDEIIGATSSVSQLTGELLAFSSRGSLKIRQIKLGKCLKGIQGVLEKTISSSITVEVNVKDDEKVNIDPDRIEQAIVHIAVNANEAMSGKGKLVISACPAKLSRTEKEQLQAGVHEKDRHKGEFALLKIEDTGCGMTDETLCRVFEPFFTTKKEKSNAGLGLSTVYNIVQQHDGFIDIVSRPGKGSTVLIYLPVND